jgi:hypothetical protein
MTPEQRREWQRAWYAANKDRINAKRRAIYAADPEKVRAEVKEWRAKNPDLVRAISKRNWEKQRDTHLARQRAYYRANREALLARLKTKNEGRGRELYERRRKLWEANPGLRARAMARIEKWKREHPDEMSLYHAKRVLSMQTGLRFAGITDELAQAKLAQLEIHRWSVRKAGE